MQVRTVPNQSSAEQRGGLSASGIDRATVGLLCSTVAAGLILIQELLKMMGIQTSHTTHCHPQGDPQPEHFIHTLVHHEPWKGEEMESTCGPRALDIQQHQV